MRAVLQRLGTTLSSLSEVLDLAVAQVCDSVCVGNAEVQALG